MMTTVQALVWSGILTFLMLLVASAFCAKPWEPGGPLIAFGNREGVAPPVGMAGRADRAAKNQMEAMVMFLAVVLAATIAGKARRPRSARRSSSGRGSCTGRSISPASSICALRSGASASSG